MLVCHHCRNRRAILVDIGIIVDVVFRSVVVVVSLLSPTSNYQTNSANNLHFNLLWHIISVVESNFVEIMRLSFVGFLVKDMAVFCLFYVLTPSVSSSETHTVDNLLGARMPCRKTY